MAEQILSRALFRNSSAKGVLMLHCLSAFMSYDQSVRRHAEQPGDGSQRPEQQIALIRSQTEERLRQYRADANQELDALRQRLAQDEAARSAMEAEIRRKQALFARLRGQIDQRLAVLHSPADDQERTRLQTTLRSYEQEVDAAVRALREQLAEQDRISEQDRAQQAVIQAQLAEAIQQAEAERDARIAQVQHTPQPPGDAPEVGLQQLKEQLPPVAMNSAAAALDRYSIRARLRDRQYLLQCTAGQVSVPLCAAAARTLEADYPQVVRGETATLPYVLDRKCGVYQVFFHQRADEDAAWQHFRTLCLGQCLLHNRYSFELTVFDGTSSPRELQLPGYTHSTIRTGEALSAFLNRVEGECQALRSACLRDQYQTVWDYLQDHPGEQQVTRCIALWNMPDGLTAQVLEQIERMYALAERCGVSFLMAVNAGTEAPQTLCDTLAHMTDQLNPLEYDPEIRAYRDLRAQSVCFQVVPLNELLI